MIVISSNVAYFILGFIAGIITLVLLSIYIIKREEKKRMESLKALNDIFAKIDDKKDE